MTPTALSIENDSGIEADIDLLVRAIAATMIDQRVHLDSELSVVLVDNDEMARLHVEWMDLAGPTDVLSFPMDEMTPTPPGVDPEPGMLGDIVLAPEFAQVQADQAGHSLDRELALLAIHGLLHLLGYDHAEPDEERAMFDLQSRLLASVSSGSDSIDGSGTGASA